MSHRRRLSLPVFAALLAVIGLLTTLANGGSTRAQDASVATPGGTLPGNPSIQLVQVASEMVDPLNVTGAGDGSGRIFVVERVGRIQIIDADGNQLPEPFLDLSQGFSVKTDFLEQGLLGLAFHPDYATNGRFFVYYDSYVTNGALDLVEYHVSADDPNKADPDSAKLIVHITGDPYINHNGGSVRFGPDGFLYWSTGDGGLAGDPYDNAQNIRNPFGKIHRINVDETGTEPYTIPADNPYAETGLVAANEFAVADAAAYHPGADRTIWAYGLRNPWQFNFDSETGDLYIADVGQNAVEEIDFQEAGAAGGQNYGWDWQEGSHCYPETLTECSRGQVGVLPVAEYDHSTGDCSISGLGVSRTTESPELDGIYFSSDYCSGIVRGLERDDSGAWVFQDLLDTDLLVTGGGIDDDGAVYLTSCSCEYSRTYDPYTQSHGALWKIVQADQVTEGDATPEPVATEEAGTPTADESGEDEGLATPEGTPAAGGEASGETTITSIDVAFDPKAVTIAAGTDVTISLPNTGAALHNFSIDALGISIDIAPGETQSVVVNAPAGDYEYYCNVPGHKEAGMIGTLTVQ